MKCEIQVVDFLVCGSGIAGLSFALKAADHGKVLVVSKGKLAQTNTQLAQGGIAYPVGKADSIQQHFKDTLAAGSELVNPEAAKVLTQEGPERIKELIAWGAEFQLENQKFQLAREAAHTFSRIIHSPGFNTGQEIQRALLKAAGEKSIPMREQVFLLDLFGESGEIRGGMFWDLNSRTLLIILSQVTLLATGGCGEVYLYNSNSPLATGDGIGIAYRAGAALEDMEMTQFHPTALYTPDSGGNLALISEALRGEGAVLKNKNKQAFMPDYHLLGDLAPRDITSRAILQEMKKTSAPCVYLDVSRVSDFPRKFPYIFQLCKQAGVEVSSGLIPVRPAMHYLMGGVKTDLWGRTNLKGLYAAGEVACTQTHGANRLASNSLLEGLVFGARAVEKAREEIKTGVKFPELLNGLSPVVLQGVTPILNHMLRVYPGIEEKLRGFRQELRKVMEENVGIVRNEKGLKTAHTILRKMADQLAELFKPPLSQTQTFLPLENPQALPFLWELSNLLSCSLLITRFARDRKESRGAHFRWDYPENNPDWQRHQSYTKSQES